MAKILIAEDERDIRDLIVITLQLGGYEVVAGTNGAEAVDLAPSEKPDLIMLDVRMPKMTGYEACAALKANPTTKEIPVIFLSAKGQESEINTGLSAGATAYILKPFAPDHLIAKVKEVLSQKKTTAAPTPAPTAKEAVDVPETKKAETTSTAKEVAKTPVGKKDAERPATPAKKEDAKTGTETTTASSLPPQKPTEVKQAGKEEKKDAQKSTAKPNAEQKDKVTQTGEKPVEPDKPKEPPKAEKPQEAKK
ncbi:MAG: response regulator [Anaerolineae bacterium]|nr:response regulator [Anaerolineae bacterium]